MLRYRLAVLGVPDAHPRIDYRRRVKKNPTRRQLRYRLRYPHRYRRSVRRSQPAAGALAKTVSIYTVVNSRLVSG